MDVNESGTTWTKSVTTNDKTRRVTVIFYLPLASCQRRYCGYFCSWSTSSYIVIPGV